MGYGQPNWDKAPTVRAVDRAGWKPNAWIFYPGEERENPLWRGDIRNKVGKQANGFIQRLMNLPRE
jgi:hypothetical protein